MKRMHRILFIVLFVSVSVVVSASDTKDVVSHLTTLTNQAREQQIPVNSFCD